MVAVEALTDAASTATTTRTLSRRSATRRAGDDDDHRRQLVATKRERGGQVTRSAVVLPMTATRMRMIMVGAVAILLFASAASTATQKVAAFTFDPHSPGHGGSMTGRSRSRSQGQPCGLLGPQNRAAPWSTPLIPVGRGVVPTLTTTTVLFAKQRRRKRRSDDDESASEGTSEEQSSPSFTSDVDDDLPDFVLAEDLPQQDSALPTPIKKSSSGSAAAAVPPVVTADAAAFKNKETKSVRELLGDRSLEKKMVFDDGTASNEPLPDLSEMARKASASASTKSAKRQEQASRKAALQAAASSSSDDDTQDPTKLVTDALSKLPLVTNDKGEITPQKVLEAGTWLGIFLLVAWEVYINSPFFDRSGPMAPVVY